MSVAGGGVERNRGLETESVWGPYPVLVGKFLSSLTALRGPVNSRLEKALRGQEGKEWSKRCPGRVYHTY